LQNLPVTKITEQVMECRSNAETDDYLYLDPKLLKGGDVLPKNRAPLAPITRSKIENLAAAALHAGCVANIHRVYDQYVNFISLEDDFFVLKHQQSDQLSYYAINRANTRDEEMEALMDSIVDSLFALFVTLGNVPIIRCPRNSAAEMVARKLEKKLRENLWDARANLFHMDATQAGGGVFSFQRPVLLLLDRNMDLATPLHHTWSYQALVHDVLDLGLNLVYVEDETASAGKLIESFISCLSCRVN